MKIKAENFLKHKDRTIPVLSFPSTELLGISVRELISSAEMQAKGMKAIVDNCPVGASLNMMDLSVEAEAFGASIRFSDIEVPTVLEGIINDIEDVDGIVVPKVGAGRTAICIEGVKKAKEEIKDLPVFCGVIGPYSLAGRLFNMSELMIAGFEEPEKVKVLLSKTTEFLKNYIKAFKEAGADGVIMAEPAAGLLSADFAEEFSMPFVNEIFDAVNSDDFITCYHNCGNSVNNMLDLVAEVKADIIHLGNAIDLKKALEILPKDKIVMGNVDPVLFKTGEPEKIKAEVKRVFGECSTHENFMISTCCDVPAEARWDNIKAYFDTVKELYA